MRPREARLRPVERPFGHTIEVIRGLKTDELLTGCSSLQASHPKQAASHARGRPLLLPSGLLPSAPCKGINRRLVAAGRGLAVAARMPLWPTTGWELHPTPKVRRAM